MKYNNFKKNIKKEFNENYNDEKKEKNKSSISIWIKLIPVYSLALLAILLVFILTAQRNPSYITEFDKNIELYSEDLEYKELKKVSSEEIQNYRNYLKYKENKEKTKNIWDIDLIFGNKGTAPETSGGANQEFTSIDTNNQEEGVIEADIAKFDGTYFYYTIRNSFVIYDLSGNKLLTENVGYNSKLEIYGNKIIIYNYSKFNIYSFDGEKLTNLYKLEDETIEFGFIVPRNDTTDTFLKNKAKEFGIDYLCPVKVNSDDFYEVAQKYACDLFVSMSYNQIFHRRIYNLPPLKTINCHAGQLPASGSSARHTAPAHAAADRR